MEYKKYKDLCIKRLDDFREYCDEIEKHANELRQKKFNAILENIKENLNRLSINELKVFADTLTKDKDVPDEVSEMVSYIGIARILESSKDIDDFDIMALMIMLELMKLK